jgi:transglycosylase-like protein
MRRLLRVLLVLIGAIAALAVGLVLAVFLWAYTALRPDLSPPDPASVPPNVLSLLRLDVGSKSYLVASRLLVDYGPTRDLRYGPAQLLAMKWIEYAWTEDEAIAEIALHSYFGQGFYGVHEAAHGYFGVPAESLTVEQAAALVAITWSPSRLSPWCHADENSEHVRKLLDALPGEDVARSLEGLLPPAADACAREGS